MNEHPSMITQTNEISGFPGGEGSEIQLEMENRIRNLLWTVSGDYAQEMKPDISLYRRSRPLEGKLLLIFWIRNTRRSPDLEISRKC